MSFNAEVLKDGRGRVIRLDFSVDEFATTLARYGTHSGKLDGTNFYEPRVVSVGTLSRGFGVDHIAAAGTVEVVIDNTDGVADWLASRDGMSDLAKLRVRIYVALFDLAVPTSFDAAQLGEFSLAEWPHRNNTSVRMSLADDILSSLSRASILPTVADWAAIGTSATNLLKDGYTCGYETTPDTPIQLAWGEDWVRCHDPILTHSTNAAWATGTLSNNAVDSTYNTVFMAIPVCVSAWDVGVTATEVEELRVTIRDADGGVSNSSRTVSVPARFSWGYTINGQQRYSHVDVWRARRSAVVTVGGRDFRVVYIELDVHAFHIWAGSIRTEGMNWGMGLVGFANSYDPSWPTWDMWLPGYQTFSETSGLAFGSDTALQNHLAQKWGDYKASVTRISAWYARGCPLSAVNSPTTRDQHACDVLGDIATYYSSPAVPVDSPTFARVKRSTPSSRCSGVAAAPWGRRDENGNVRAIALRAAVTGICQSSDFDVFVNKSGFLSVAAYGNDADIADAIAADSLVRIDEERLVSFEDWVPAEGERGAPYNRVTLLGGKSNWAIGADVPPQGPWILSSDNETGVAASDRIISAELQQGWRPWAQIIDNPLQWRHLETYARPRVRFTTDISALRLELGDFFRLTWGRNVSPAVYDAAVFQTEIINYSPDSDQVEVEAIWRNDVATDLPYLLDNQTYLLVVAASGGRTATVADSSNVVTFSSGSLVADGVVVGDTLVLLDATQGDSEFSRFRALLVSDVTSTTTLEVDDADLDFGGGLAVATWEIRRGATTYPTSITDPTNYPTGGEMYGKVASNITNEYSDNSGPNYLLDG